MLFAHPVYQILEFVFPFELASMWAFDRLDKLTGYSTYTISTGYGNKTRRQIYRMFYFYGHVLEVMRIMRK